MAHKYHTSKMSEQVAEQVHSCTNNANSAKIHTMYDIEEGGKEMKKNKKKKKNKTKPDLNIGIM